MTREHAETVANVLIGAAVVGVAVFALSDPARRRGVWTVLRRAAAASGPWLLLEARQAWVSSGARQTPDPGPGQPGGRRSRGI